MAAKTYYEILEVEPTATAAEIKQSWRLLRAAWHPDKVRGDSKRLAEEKFKQIEQAYGVLSDPQKRARYDRKLAQQRQADEDQRQEKEEQRRRKREQEHNRREKQWQAEQERRRKEATERAAEEKRRREDESQQRGNQQQAAGTERQELREQPEVIGTVAAFFAGVGWIGLGIIASAHITTLPFLLDSAIPLIAVVGTLGGLVGLDIRQRTSYGNLGTAGSLVTRIGTALLLAYYLLILFRMSAMGAAGWLLGLGICVLVPGFVLLGVATLRARVLPRWSGVALLALPISFLLIPIGGWLVYGLIWMALSYTLWRHRFIR